MRKQIIIIIILNFISLSIFAQYSIDSRKTYSGRTLFNVSAMGGYFMSGKISDGNTTFDPKNILDYSINVGYTIRKDYEIEFSYIGANPKSHLTTDGNTRDITLRNHYNYFLVGAMSYYEMKRFHPFYEACVGGICMSTKYLSGINDDFEDYKDEYNTTKWMFAAEVGLGMKIDITDELGIRFEGRLLMPMTFNGLGVGVNVGSGGIYPNIQLNSYSIMLQGDISIGAYYNF